MQLADGTHAYVTIVERIAETAEPLTTYNFEVDEWHTYFAGELPVWVHNTGKGWCDSIKAQYHIEVKINGRSAAGAWKEVRDQLGVSIQRGKFNWSDLPEVQESLWKQMNKDYPEFTRTRLTEDIERKFRSDGRDIWASLTGRRASVDDMEIHHLVQLEWSHLFPERFPNRFENMVAVDKQIHDLITADWRRFKTALNQRVPTQAEVLAQEARIRDLYGQYFKSFPAPGP